jgi:hypothetical protein
MDTRASLDVKVIRIIIVRLLSVVSATFRKSVNIGRVASAFYLQVFFPNVRAICFIVFYKILSFPIVLKCLRFV